VISIAIYERNDAHEEELQLLKILTDVENVTLFDHAAARFKYIIEHFSFAYFYVELIFSNDL